MKGEKRDTTMANTCLCASRVYTYVYVSACVRVRETEQRGEVERGAHADSRRGTGQPRRRRRERRGEAGERRWRYAVKPWEPTAARASRSPLLLSSHLHLSFYRIAPTAPAASRSIASAAAQPPLLLLLSSPSVVSSRFYSSYLSRARKRIQSQRTRAVSLLHLSVLIVFIVSCGFLRLSPFLQRRTRRRWSSVIAATGAQAAHKRIPTRIYI